MRSWLSGWPSWIPQPPLWLWTTISPVLLFALKDPMNIIRALKGEKIGTIVKEDTTK